MADPILAALALSRKYADLDEGLLERVVAEERARHPKEKEALKAVKDRLHQIHGAYAGDGTRALLRKAQEAGVAGQERFFLERHASTRERLPIAEAFFSAVRAFCPAARSVLDLGCGLDPLFLPLLPESIQSYTALDISKDAAALLNLYFAEKGLPEGARTADLLVRDPETKADLALLFKLLPLLERQKKGRSRELLRSLRVTYAAVSFPSRSLSGRRKGMEESYAAFLREMLPGTGWSVEEERAFPGELLYLLKRR